MLIAIKRVISIADAKAAVETFYKPERHKVTKSERKKADLLDKEIENLMKKIVENLKKKKLYRLLGKKGKTIKPYFEIGKELNSFVGKLHPASDEEKYLLESIYYYAIKYKLYNAQDKKIESNNEPKKRFKQKNRNPTEVWCKLAEHPWDIIEKGSWKMWADIYMSPVVSSDERIVRWLIEKIGTPTGLTPNQVRPILIELRNDLKNYDTSVLNDQEIKEKLEKIKEKFDVMNENQQSQTEELIEEVVT